MLSVIAYGLSGGVDPARQGGFGNDATVPNTRDQLVFADDVIAPLNKEMQEIENKGFDSYWIAVKA